MNAEIDFCLSPHLCIAAYCGRDVGLYHVPRLYPVNERNLMSQSCTGGAGVDPSKKRKYTLQEIEVEGFNDSGSDSEKHSLLYSEPEVSTTAALRRHYFFVSYSP